MAGGVDRSWSRWMDRLRLQETLPLPPVPTRGVCESRNRTKRKKHDLDKDGRCVFCDWLKP